MNASVIRTAICGDSKVGKSSLCLRLVNKKPPLTYQSTIGMDLESKILPERRIKIDYWDLAGNRKYEPLAVLYMKNISVIILVYSAQNLESLNRIKQIYNEYKNFNPPKKFIIVGTHFNSQNRHKNGIEFAKKQNIPHFFVDNNDNKDNECFNVIQEFILNNHSSLEPKKTQSYIENKYIDDDNKKDNHSSLEPKKRLSCMENLYMDANKKDNCNIS